MQILSVRSCIFFNSCDFKFYEEMCNTLLENYSIHSQRMFVSLLLLWEPVCSLLIVLLFLKKKIIPRHQSTLTA